MLPNELNYEESQVNLVVDLELISGLIKSFTQCGFCANSNCVELDIDPNFKAGLVHKLVIKCTKRKNFSCTMSSKTIHNMYETNLRFAYALRSIGKGNESAKLFSAVINLSPPSTKFAKYTKKLTRAAIEVNEASMRNAAVEAIQLNNGDHNIAAAFDGTWQ